MRYFITFDKATGQILGAGESRPGLIDAVEDAATGVLRSDEPLTEWVAGMQQVALPAARLANWERVKVKRDAVIDGGAMTPIGMVDSDALSRTNIIGAVVGAQIAKSVAQPFSIEWTAQDNSIHSLNADGMIGLGLAVLAHTSVAHDKARTLRIAMEGAADLTALLTIDIEAGWP